MKQIPLTQGKFALVDDADFGELTKFKWAYCRYAYRREYRNGKGKTLYMHRVILNTPEGMDTDHINRDKLDNRRANLRICTHSQNEANTDLRRNNTSGFKGVSFHRQTKKWEAKIMCNRQKVHLGLFNNIVLAALAYNAAAKKYHGGFALLNKV